MGLKSAICTKNFIVIRVKIRPIMGLKFNYFGSIQQDNKC